MWIALLLFAAWQVVGAGFVLASAGATSPEMAQLLFSAAFAAGYGGAFFSLVAYYVRCRDRGDF